MDANELEEVMARFVAGETDVLLSTTIIESGLDIPNANTIIIDRADRFDHRDGVDKLGSEVQVVLVWAEGFVLHAAPVRGCPWRSVDGGRVGS